MRMIVPSILFCLLATGQGPGVGDAPKEEPRTFDEVIADAARVIAERVGQGSVSVGSITTSVDLPGANAGPGIAEQLRAALGRLKPGGVLAGGAAFQVQGSLFLVPNPSGEPGLKMIRLNLSITNKLGEQVNIPGARFLRANSDIVRVLNNISGDLPLDPRKDQNEQKVERNREIQRLAEHPSVFVDPRRPTMVASSATSPYRVEVLAGPLGDGSTRPAQARPVRVDAGLASVDIARGEVYEVRVYNASPDEVAARVFIDGFDAFHFSEVRDPRDPARPGLTHYIVAGRTGEPAGSVATIPGWHQRAKGRDNFLAFLVTAYGQGASSKGVPARPGEVGVIQVQFSKTRSFPADGRPRSAGNETGFGPPRQGEQEVVKREVEPPISVVSIRYTR